MVKAQSSVCFGGAGQTEERPWEKLLGREGGIREERPKKQLLCLQPRTFHMNAGIDPNSRSAKTSR